MSKSHALGWATVAGITAVCCWFISGLGYIGTTAFIVCVGFLLRYGYKRYSHALLLEQAKAEVKKEPTKQVIEVTNRGSSHLFVPKSLDRP